ncbi:hypothetical protein M9H77_02435 [Catharanthus roseus]|uniref:Uncharacterized protein n=1 Tax=Catharanthus roseus TaxID=4058 RepID=A0ACC0C8X0_CATRO|nr:hypothetical protein M9H77_02435 [Catharanthus roseus]
METTLNSFALIFYKICLEHPCTWTSMLGRNHTMEFDEQGEIIGKELLLSHEDSLISNPSLLSHEVSYMELKLFLASCISNTKYDIKAPKDHSTNSKGATSCIKEVKTSGLKASTRGSLVLN